jgi:hypothetical protein
LLPPMVLLRVASSLCPSVRVLQVLLLCPFMTLKPCDQQYPVRSHLAAFPAAIPSCWVVLLAPLADECFRR